MRCGNFPNFVTSPVATIAEWGGLALLKRMLDGMGFRQTLSSWGLPAPGSNRCYDPAQLIEQFIV